MAVLPPPGPGCASCAARDELIAEQGQAIGELEADVLALAEEVRELRRRLGRNSGNSSMAPSADDLPGRTPPEQKPRLAGGKRKRGRQPGAPGAYLAWSDHPDAAVPHFPQGRRACGDDLAAARDPGVRYSRQVTDLPGAKAQATRHDRHEVQCSCGRARVADAPPQPGAPGTVTCGLNFRAWCVFLMVMHHVPVGRCADILESMPGTRPPRGGRTPCRSAPPGPRLRRTRRSGR